MPRHFCVPRNSKIVPPNFRFNKMKIFFVLIHLNIMVILNQKHVLRLVKYLLIVVRIVCSGTNIGKISIIKQTNKSNSSLNNFLLINVLQKVLDSRNGKSKLTRPVQNSKFTIEKKANPT